MSSAIANVLSGAALRAWLEAGMRQLDDSNARSLSDALSWARRVLVSRVSPDRSLNLDNVEPDHLYALANLIREDSSAEPEYITAWYDALEAMSWQGDFFGERLELLSLFGYCAWRQYRRAEQPAAERVWEAKTVALTELRASVPEFLTLAETQYTRQIRERFLRDPAVLLTYCSKLPELLNHSPEEGLRQAIGTHTFLFRSADRWLSDEERRYFLANLELDAAVGEKGCGNYNEAGKWLLRAASSVTKVLGTGVLMARLEYVHRAIAHELGYYAECRDGLAELRGRFASFGMDRYVARCFFLDGVSLKELGRDEEAVLALADVCKSQSPDVEQWMKALAATHMAEIHGRQGRYAKAGGALADAWDLLKLSSVPTALAHFHGVRGEILRDSGCFEEAAESYRLASAVYASSGMSGFEAYLRVLRAETLILANRESDAVAEIMAALPAIETLGLMREGMTALALLRESLKGQEADRNALGALKQELQDLNRGGRS